MELLTGKTLLVLMSGLLTALLNMLSMSLVLWRTFSSMIPGPGGGAAENFNISLGGLALTYLAAVPAILFFSCLVLIVGLIARNFREANSFASPVMMLPLSGIFVAMLSPPSTVPLMLTPVVNTTLIIRDVLMDQASAKYFLLAFGSSCVYAGLMLSAAVRLFSNEQLVNPSWEPLTLSNPFRRGRTGKPRGLPSIDATLSVLAVSTLLLLYAGPTLLTRFGTLGGMLVQHPALIAGPALLLAWLARYRWVETFQLRLPRPAGAAALLAGLIAGVALVPVIQALNLAQNTLWPGNPDLAYASAKIFLPVLAEHPVLASLTMAALAGVCEELLYHGLVQTALLRRLPPVGAIVVTALLFSLAHFDAHGVPLRDVLGVVFGWLVYRTGSLFPAILAHFAYDAASMGLTAWSLRGADLQQAIESARHEGASGPSSEWLLAAIIGLAVAATCMAVIYQNSRPRAVAPPDSTTGR
jgi:membrane protease YdiL (CAAX protease family)